MSTPQESAGGNIEVVVGNLKLAIPIYRDEETTLQVIEDLNRVLADIESKSTRIDSQRFIVLAAIHYAFSHREALDNARDATTEAIRIVNAVAERIMSLIEDFSAQGE